MPSTHDQKEIMDKSTAVKQPSDLNVGQPHSARIYDYFLGGKDNFPADREAAEEILAVEPDAGFIARTNRAFVARTTRWLAGEVGVRQFLDVGTGIPAPPNLHEIAQGIAPEARVVYVDNDSIVLVHARALLTSTPQGRTAYLDADLQNPQSIINASELRETLDLERPVALSLNAILHFVVDDDEVAGIVAGLVAGLPTRSYLVLSHITPEMNPATAEQVSRRYEAAGIPLKARTAAQLAGIVEAAGCTLEEPGLVPIALWRPEGEPDVAQRAVWLLGAVARVS
jgi:hypothetical protein